MTNFNRPQPAYLSSDNLHPGDLGNSVMDKAVFRRVLANLCGISLS